MSLLSRFLSVNLSRSVPASIALSVAAATPVLSEDWPTLRGPQNNGISSEAALSTEAEFPVAWKAKVGLGHSAVVVADGRAFTMGHDGANTDTVWCFDAATGDVIWKHSYEHPLDDLYFPGGTTGTPTVDGEHLYSVARRGQLFCFDAATGEVKWQKHLTEDLGCRMPDWGFTGAPLVSGDMLLLNAGEAGVALKKSDGSVIWKSDVDEEAGYSTPELFEKGGKTWAFFSSKDGYFCVDPASGEQAWFYKHKTRYGVNATEPIMMGDQIFLSTGYDKGSVLLSWNGTGEPEVVWRSRDYQNQMNTSLLIDGLIYGINGNEGKDGTGLVCVKPETGELLWTDTSIGHGAITAAGDQLIVLSEKGELSVGPASRDGFSPATRQQVLTPKCWAVPVLANGLLYCRNDKGDVVALKVR